MNYNRRRITQMFTSLFYVLILQAIFFSTVPLFADRGQLINLESSKDIFIIAAVLTFLFGIMGFFKERFLEKRIIGLEYSSIIILLNIFVGLFSVYDVGKNIFT